MILPIVLMLLLVVSLGQRIYKWSSVGDDPEHIETLRDQGRYVIE